MPHIFISYSGADRSTTEELAKLLSQTYDHVWYDKKLKGGDEWWEEILKQIALCDHFIYLISKEALDSEFCQKEWTEAQRLKKHLVPVVVRTCNEIPKELTNLQLIFMTSGIDTEGLNQLYSSLVRASKHERSIELHEPQRAADLKLLRLVWPLISSRNIARLDNETQWHYIDKDFYDHEIWYYLHLRDLYENPQNDFFDPVLKKAFEAFDAALQTYHQQKGKTHSPENIEDQRVYISNYKYVTTVSQHEVTEKLIAHKLEEYEKTVEAVLEVRRYHRVLVKAVRTVFPDFDFSENENGDSET